ncbi:MAG: hypothetical protein H6608_04105 [Flavobacteriales bacterium]|nr:hypothetical protein [Flavobacteriales bacterium]
MTSFFRFIILKAIPKNTDAHNSFLSRVLEHRTGNPISMAIVYSLIAQRLNIPVYGVNLPQHFVLGYRSEEGLEIIRRFNDPSALGMGMTGDVMFYINPFSEGLILNHESLSSSWNNLTSLPEKNTSGCAQMWKSSNVYCAIWYSVIRKRKKWKRPILPSGC